MEKDKHKHYDELWLDEKTKKFTLAGRQAINATKALIIVITKTAKASSSGLMPASLISWDTFKGEWLVPSPTLSQTRDFAFDFVLKHQTGIRFGASNIKTLNMDEEQMAKNLILEAGIDMKKVYDVFHRLDQHYNSDSDDVAVLYVNKVKLAKGSVQEAFKRNKLLISLLKKVLEKGYTGENEKATIKYLNSL